MSSAPRVSIVIPVYNGSNYLEEAIDSALSQTWDDVEVLVVDDGSDDDGRTAAVAAAYGDRIRYLRIEHRGVAAALNTGIEAMTGELFSWLSHDDLYTPGKVERQVRALERLGPGVIVYGDYALVDFRGRVVKHKELRQIDPAAFRYRLLFDTSLHGCTFLVPRGCFEEERFDESLATTQDYDLWFRLAASYRFVHQPGMVLHYRIHSEQESWRNPSCSAEGDELLISFLDQVTADEIRRCTRRPLSQVYAWAAAAIELRGFSGAARYALELSRRHAGSAAERFSPLRLAAILAYRLADPRLRPMMLWRRLTFPVARLEAGR